MIESVCETQYYLLLCGRCDVFDLVNIYCILYTFAVKRRLCAALFLGSYWGLEHLS